jgi:CBS domain containing-hemolysin-like protein
MLFFFLGLLLLAGSLISLILLRAYEHIPAREVKRLARHGDDTAKVLYRAAAYTTDLRVFLKGCILFFAIASLAAFIHVFGFWAAVFIELVVSGICVLVFVPSGEVKGSGLWLAKRSAPALQWLLERLHPVLQYCTDTVRRWRPVRVHTGLYQKSDLAELLEQQKGQHDSRISNGEIDLLQHALTFGDKFVSETLTPKRVVKEVSADEDIGPILMQDLHASGHSRFPVYEGSTDNIVGILYLHDLVARKHTGKVSSVMNTRLTYVHEDFTLFQTLQAFLKTKQHLFLVVNSLEELVGIITVEDILEEIIGKQIVDEFDHYDDLRAVAKASAKKEHDGHTEPEAEPTVEPTGGKIAPVMKIRDNRNINPGVGNN